MEPHTLAVPLSAAEAERSLRRVRSEGDIVDDVVGGEPSPYRRPGRHVLHRSEGQWAVGPSFVPQTPTITTTAPTSPVVTTRVPPPSLQRPTPAFLRNDIDDAEILENISEELQMEMRRAARRRARRRVPPGWWGKLMVFIGQVGPDARVRSKLMSFVWSFSFGIVQFVVITALLAYSSKHESPTIPGETEWEACQRPLGAWNSIWIIRNFFGCLYSYWSWQVEVKHSQQRTRGFDDSDPEAAFTTHSSTRPTRNNRRSARDPGSPMPPRFNTPNHEERPERPPTPPVLLARLGNITDCLGIVWFLTAHVLVYTSVKTCRFAAPHLWWLSFSILCILYFMILEVFLVGLIVFIFWPVFYLAWSIILLCLGRHPVQRTPVKHEIGKMAKSAVDQIPLVLYIPTPPEDNPSDKEKDGETPSIPYTYPPLSKTQSTRKRRFAFLRRSKKAKSGSYEKRFGSKDGEPKTWEDNWVSGDYPFVRLEGNRAACAICLMDFEEPQRIQGVSANDATPEPSPPSDASAEMEVQEVQVDEVTQEDARRLKLEDAGEGSQPLRLLGCGHVFHKTCIDPWLIDVSGRCPVCQRAVQTPKDSKTKG